MKIKRYQTGGIYYTPFFRDSINQQESQSIVNTTSRKDKEDNLVQKEIINVLKENGLPNDVDYFLSKADTFLKKSQNIGSLFNTSQNITYDMSDLIRLQSLANRIKHNNVLYEQASNQIIDEGSGSEAAITNTGDLYVIDEDKEIKTITTDTYYNNREKYRVLTNSELIRLREEQPELAFNGSILTDLSNTVGMKSIVDYVKSTIGSFGTNKSSNKFDRYTSKQKAAIEKGFEQLLGFDSPDGVYKVSSNISKDDQGYNDPESLKIAVNYLYRTLPNNMKNILRANAAAEGLNPGNIEDVQSLLTMAVVEHTNHTNEVEQSLDYDSSASKQSGVGGPKERWEEMTREEMMTTGEGGVKYTPIVISSSKSRNGIKILAQPYGKPLDTSGNQIGMGTIRDVFGEKDRIGSSVALNSVSYGDKILNENDLDHIVYDGVSNIERAYLPINQTIYASTGKIVPDLDAIRRYEEFREWLNDGYGILPNSVAVKLAELNLDLVQDPNTKEWVFRDIKPFFMVNGYASDKAVDLDDNSEWIDHVDREQGSRIFDLYSKYINYGSNVASKSKRRDDFSGGWFGNAGSMYKSIIFLPITDAAIATVTSNHQLTSSNNFVDILNKRNIAEERQSIQTNF